MLSEQAADREHEIYQLLPTRSVHSDDKSDAESYILDSFHSSGGNEAISNNIDFTQLSFRSFMALFSH